MQAYAHGVPLTLSILTSKSLDESNLCLMLLPAYCAHGFNVSSSLGSFPALLLHVFPPASCLSFLRTPYTHILLPGASYRLLKLCNFLTVFFLLSQRDHLHRPDFTFTLSSATLVLTGHCSVEISILVIILFGELPLMSLFSSVWVTHSCFFVS